MINRAWLVVSCLCVVLSPLAACGGGSDGPSCTTFAACGGDIAGVWTIDGICGAEELTDENCPAATITSSVDLSGTVTFGADGSYSAHTVSAVSATITYPASCLEGTGVTSCEQLQGTSTDVTCTGSVTASCKCSGSSNDTSDESGTYTTSGNTATITANGTTVLEYCVNGNSLQAREQGTTSYIALSK